MSKAFFFSLVAIVLAAIPAAAQDRQVIFNALRKENVVLFSSSAQDGREVDSLNGVSYETETSKSDAAYINARATMGPIKVAAQQTSEDSEIINSITTEVDKTLQTALSVGLVADQMLFNWDQAHFLLTRLDDYQDYKNTNVTLGFDTRSEMNRSIDYLTLAYNAIFMGAFASQGFGKVHIVEVDDTGTLVLDVDVVSNNFGAYFIVDAGDDLTIRYIYEKRAVENSIDLFIITDNITAKVSEIRFTVGRYLFGWSLAVNEFGYRAGDFLRTGRERTTSLTLGFDQVSV